VVVEKDGEN